MIAQSFVGLSRLKTRNLSSKNAPGPFNVGAMKNRFPTDRRTSWRQRFLAIARELDAAPVHRRESLDAVHAVRARLSLTRRLRGIRLGCMRTA